MGKEEFLKAIKESGHQLREPYTDPSKAPVSPRDPIPERFTKRAEFAMHILAAIVAKDVGDMPMSYWDNKTGTDVKKAISYADELIHQLENPLPK